jgi:hypothetical protein
MYSFAKSRGKDCGYRVNLCLCDSGATLKEIGKFFSNLGAIKISPIVIAKTVGGDQA